MLNWNELLFSQPLPWNIRKTKLENSNWQLWKTLCKNGDVLHLHFLAISHLPLFSAFFALLWPLGVISLWTTPTNLRIPVRFGQRKALARDQKTGRNEIWGLFLLDPSHKDCDGPAGPLSQSPQLPSGCPLLASKYCPWVLVCKPSLSPLGRGGVLTHWATPSMLNIPSWFSFTLPASL